MFSSRRMIFSDVRPRRPFLRTLGFALAAALIFAAGVYTGQNFPHILGSRQPAPVAAAEF